MVALLVGLQLKLTWRSFKGSASRIVAGVILSMNLFGALAAVLVGSVFLAGMGPSWVGPITTLAMAAFALGWPMFAVLVGGGSLEPGRFALLPLSSRELRPGLALASLMGAGGVLAAGLVLGLAISWRAHPGALAALVVCAPLGVALVVTLTRMVTAWLAAALRSRKFADAAGVILGLVAAGSGIVIQLVANLAVGEDGMDLEQVMDRLGTIAGWTPFGWAWAVPWDVAAGRWVEAGVRAALTAAMLAVCWRAWGVRLDAALTSPLEASGAGAKVKADSLLERLTPDSAVGAICARSLRYWRRDPRHLVLAVTVLLVPALLAILPVIRGDEDAAFSVVPTAVGISVLFSYLLVSSETSYDGSALWVHITTGVRGWEDRLGRGMAVAPLLPVMLAATLAVIAATGGADSLMLVATIQVAGLLVGAGVGSWSGAVWQQAMPPPGGNPLSRGSMGSMAQLLGMMVSLLAAGLLILPAIGMGFLAQGAWSVLGLVASLAYGCGVVALGVWLGGRRLEATWPEVLARVGALE